MLDGQMPDSCDKKLSPNPDAEQPEPDKRRAMLFKAWRLLLILSVCIHLFPIRTGLIRVALVLSTLLVWIGLPFWINYRASRVAWCLTSLIVIALVFGPGRPDVPGALRCEYVQSLRNYTGVFYIWGGESSRGIDCSGLVRVGLIDANFRRGVLTLNPKLIREGIALWWYDSSADALMKEYRGNSKRLLDTKGLNFMDYSRIAPGDFAVSESGLHTLAYLGEHTWIEADPNRRHVVCVTCPSPDIWFSTPMRLMRWRQLEN